MSLPLIITPDAEQDLAEAKAWYERKREGLGEEFLLCLDAALAHIRRFPEAATEVSAIRGDGKLGPDRSAAALIAASTRSLCQ